jgi:hypothetical protein
MKALWQSETEAFIPSDLQRGFWDWQNFISAGGMKRPMEIGGQVLG